MCFEKRLKPCPSALVPNGAICFSDQEHLGRGPIPSAACGHNSSMRPEPKAQSLDDFWNGRAPRQPFFSTTPSCENPASVRMICRLSAAHLCVWSDLQVVVDLRRRICATKTPEVVVSIAMQE